MKIIDGQRVATIGDYSRNGLYQITHTAWDHNGTLCVTVRMVDRTLHADSDIRAMRRLARRALMHPQKTRSARLLQKWREFDGLRMMFAVSRLPAS